MIPLLLPAATWGAPLEPCPGGTARIPGGGAEVEVAIHAEEPARAEELARGAAEAWARLGLTLRWRVEPATASLDPSSAEALVASVAALLAEEARPARARVDVWLVPTLAAPGSDLARLAGPVYGLSASRPLFAIEPGPLADAAPAGPFTPTVFLSTEALATLQPSRRPLVLAHEIGHALGLPHVRHPHNLMALRPPTCLPALSSDQVAAIVLPEEAPRAEALPSSPTTREVP